MRHNPASMPDYGVRVLALLKLYLSAAWRRALNQRHPWRYQWRIKALEFWLC
jgi:hypothetical protein